jgi:hypothetical protein
MMHGSWLGVAMDPDAEHPPDSIFVFVLTSIWISIFISDFNMTNKCIRICFL